MSSTGPVSDRTQTLLVELDVHEVKRLQELADKDNCGWLAGKLEAVLASPDEHRPLSQPEHQGDDPWLDDLREVIDRGCVAVSKGDSPDAIAAYIGTNVQAHLPSSQPPAPVLSGEELRKAFFDALDRQVRQRLLDLESSGPPPTIHLGDVHAALDTFLRNLASLEPVGNLSERHQALRTALLRFLEREAPRGDDGDSIQPPGVRKLREILAVAEREAKEAGE